MSFMYLPLMVYTATLDAMFKTWGRRRTPTIILAHEQKMLALPAPKRVNKQGGI